ncbi:Golgi vesicle transport-related protein [Zychaea mexicana]|uniref:Golgi vesicle transport-related protein n=1 Tax=Zychaea mexicana TaxID=64656 RepID=UPI0022FF029D|nr:Golgi vesicle transport-related protein [Zychaea mexicana]KAI9496836.1 Golgi vesicle transport-related protein [Zychaea mexicana]
MEEQSNFSSAIEFWRGVGLPTLQRQLDQQGLAIVENQKDGLMSRKKLAEQTREFKKMPDEDKLQQFKSLLKGYQAEIDNITRRTKYSESSFLALYKVLADAPDPAPLFEAAVDQSVNNVELETAKSENAKLRSELEEAQRQAQHVQSLEKANQELQQKLSKLESLADEKRVEELGQREEQMKQQYNEKIRSYKEREHDLQRQLNQALDQLTQLRHTHDDTQAQLLNHNQKYDEEVVGKLAELDIVMMDLERANAKIVELERKNDDLREEVEATRSESKEKYVIRDEGPDTAESQQQDAAISKLFKDIDTYKELLQSTETRLSKRIKELSNEVKSLTEEKEKLSKKLQGFDDYDEIKRELEIMKYVEFSTGDDEDRFDAQNVLKKDEGVRQSLEVSLIEKNKRLENEFTQLKVSYANIEKELATKESTYKELKAKNTTLANLVQRLEEDLLRLGQKPSSSDSLMDELTRTPSNTNIAQQQQQQQSSGPRTPDYGSPRVSYDANSVPGKDGGNDKSILPIVIGQRDRFRQRNTELESQTRSLELKLQDVQGEVETLKADNLKLYERLRFVHVWKEENKSAAVNVRRGSVKTKDDPTDKYGQLYEESMNPFVQFHRKEETRRYNALNPAEKLTFNLTRMLFSHKWSRYFLVIYSLLLHLLVVVTLYQLSLWECRHDHEAINLPTLNDDPAAVAAAAGMGQGPL